MTSIISPLRYPGGKRKLSNYLAPIIDANLPIDVFIEPFAGGAGIALDLLSSNKVKEIHLNDSDKNIYCFWSSIIRHNDQFLETLHHIPLSIEEYYHQKSIVFGNHKSKNTSNFNVGFAVFYVNRCNRSGILTKNVGPIGGKNQNGKWKFDARFNKEKLEQKIKEIRKIKNQIHVSCMDAIDFSNKFICKRSDVNIFLYFDPPYYAQGRNLYRNFFKDDGHLKLRDFLYDNNHLKWLLSYDKADFIETAYQSFSNKLIIDFDHHANNHKHNQEIVIGSNALNWNSNVK